MILSKRPEIERFLKAPDRGIRAAVIHGKDRSGVAERAEILCRTVTPDLNDPFNVTVLTDSDIDGDEARRMAILDGFYAPLVALRDETPGFGVSLASSASKGCAAGGSASP
mgnify:CR=1 FL=1